MVMLMMLMIVRNISKKEFNLMVNLWMKIIGDELFNKVYIKLNRFLYVLIK